ncbi:uncharacterized protein I303_103876 [Kwoniella dejecticola CBS 10117]|uniref:Uncharacterized protein n=1 Tax=Kwoniella dejecticola CBS 10117 TaxID=1296121 RepID=A0A1A6A7Z2_9TREE|nr:uncharacterized protein I303_03895 [Kwoniella dejecticola CBS 10117]OBR86175.1 hypothetical protein I303_03895 [Kwoniella dejecticola CBS 10117]
MVSSTFNKQTQSGFSFPSNPQSHKYRTQTSPSPTPSFKSTASSRSRSSVHRYSPYPRVKVEESDEEEVLRDIKEVGLGEGSNVKAHFRYMPKARSTSPYDDLKTARPHLMNPQSQTQSKHAAHRRAYSMSTISYGYFLLPTSPSPTLTRTPLASTSASTSQTSTPTHAASATPCTSRITGSSKPNNRGQNASPAQRFIPKTHTPPQIPTPASTRSPVSDGSCGENIKPDSITSRRLILVNPIVAHHLKHGGMVNIRSVDGQQSFKVCLPSHPRPDTIVGGRGAAMAEKRQLKSFGSVRMTRSLATSTY